jgi:hypothetical protein
VVEEGVRALTSVPWPVGGAVIGAAIGAIVAVVGTHLEQRVRQRQRDIKVRDALWRLVRTEMFVNSSSLQELSEYESPMNFLSQQLELPLSVKTWEDTRVRLAELLPREHLYYLLSYYVNVQSLLEDIRAMRIENENPELDPARKTFLEQVLVRKSNYLLRDGDDATVHLNRLVGEPQIKRGGWHKAPEDA